MQKIDRKKRDKYFKDRYHLLHFSPTGDDFIWFCKYITREIWWDDYIRFAIEKNFGANTVLTSEVIKYFLEPEPLVDSVYMFLLSRKDLNEYDEEIIEKEKVTYGKAPTECPIDPKERARCPECAERVW
jgi:hypothetical protein